MNYTQKEANKIRVGDTLTLEDGSLHKAVKGDSTYPCGNGGCSISLICDTTNSTIGIK